MQITLDGVVSGAEKWFSENYSDDAFNNGISLYEAAAAQLLGFGAYVGMASYWQNAAVDPNASALDATMGRILNAKKKVVFSKRTRN